MSRETSSRGSPSNSTRSRVGTCNPRLESLPHPCSAFARCALQCLQPRAGHRLRRDAPLFACEGALGSPSRVVGATSPRRKQRKASVVRRRAEITRKDTRVAECDLIFLEVVLHRPASNRAIDSRQRVKAPRTGVVTLRFTPRVASRSRLCDSSEPSFIKRLATIAARQGCQRWRGKHLPLDEKKTLARGSADTTEARNGVVKRRPHRFPIARWT